MSQQFIIDERLSTIQSAALPFKEQTQIIFRLAPEIIVINDNNSNVSR